MERGEQEFAPNNRDAFIEALGNIACEGECHLAVCMQDRHHLVFGKDLSEAERLIKSHPDYIVPNVCREKHEQAHKRWNRSEPLSDEFVIGFLVASPLNLNANKRKKLGELRRRK